MFRLIHSFLLTVLIVFSGTGIAYAASVPLTIEGNLGGIIPGATQRNTCNPDFMTVLENRAWEGAQREMTQNANLIPRTDSVLSLTCFDSWLDDLANYAEDNFPGDPQESEGRLLNGLLTEWLIVFPDDIVSGIDPNLSSGYVLYALLEILVLDQLENVNSITGQVQDALGLALCGATKERYLEDNFPGLMIGDRAKNQAAVPVYTQISSRLDDNVSDNNNFNGCALMNQVWQRTKCYDFATESRAYKANHSGPDHDGFYTFGLNDPPIPYAPFPAYEPDAALGGDFRTEANQCPPPDNDLVDVPSIGAMLCQVQAHGIPSLPSLAGFGAFSLAGGFNLAGGGPTWTQAHAEANPVPGTLGLLGNASGMDLYTHYLNLLTGVCDPAAIAPATCPGPPIVAACADPIKIGYIVSRVDKTYVDAVCPNPGCFFTSPGTIAGTGSCTPKP